MKKVAIIEDDTLFAAHLKRILENAGYDVRYAQHAPAAINLIDDFTPDAIVLDMLLSGSTAMPLLNELVSHEDLAHIPLVLLTSLGPDLDSDSLRAYGVREILDKSTASPKDIVASVGACFR